MSPRRRLTGALCLTLLSTPASALTFNFSQIIGDTLTSAQADAFNTAANAWSAILTDDIVVNVQIGFAALGSGILGSTSPTFLFGSASLVDSLLAADASSASDNAAVASLVTQSSTRIAVTSAQAKALGATVGSTSDGSIQFSSSLPFSTSRNADGTVAAGTYDLVGIAEHEIAHLLGFDSSIDGLPNDPATGRQDQTILDQFRYTSPGLRSTTTGAAYFSLNNGTTDIADFSNGVSYQASHWLQGTGSLLDPAVAPGVTKNITPLDIQAMDVIGYNVAVPEPATIGILLVAVIGTAWRRRRS